MIIKCTEGEKEKIMLNCCCINNLIIHESINCISSNCEKCFEEHNVKFEIVEEKRMNNVKNNDIENPLEEYEICLNCKHYNDDIDWFTYCELKVNDDNSNGLCVEKDDYCKFWEDKKNE